MLRYPVSPKGLFLLLVKEQPSKEQPSTFIYITLDMISLSLSLYLSFSLSLSLSIYIYIYIYIFLYIYIFNHIRKTRNVEPINKRNKSKTKSIRYKI